MDRQTEPGQPQAAPGIEPMEYEGYVIAVEPTAYVADEAQRLAKALAAETSSAIPWSPMTPGEMVARGTHIITVRKAGELVGVCLAHRVQDGARDAGMYLLPQHRAGLLAVAVARFTQRLMKALGAKWMVWSCDVASRSHLLAEHLGHELLTRVYLARLE